mmetsp:Transcript_36882/g.73076  ORF Transcript_36882/g.73076 Transcript_36882/m.73076 type:complete len:248 (+) Transcript_36882:2771-3514(+)
MPDTPQRRKPSALPRIRLRALSAAHPLRQVAPRTRPFRGTGLLRAHSRPPPPVLCPVTPPQRSPPAVQAPLGGQLSPARQAPLPVQARREKRWRRRVLGPQPRHVHPAPQRQRQLALHFHPKLPEGASLRPQGSLAGRVSPRRTEPRQHPGPPTRPPSLRACPGSLPATLPLLPWLQPRKTVQSAACQGPATSSPRVRHACPFRGPRRPYSPSTVAPVQHTSGTLALLQHRFHIAPSPHLPWLQAQP